MACGCACWSPAVLGVVLHQMVGSAAEGGDGGQAAALRGALSAEAGARCGRELLGLLQRPRAGPELRAEAEAFDPGGDGHAGSVERLLEALGPEAAGEAAWQSPRRPVRAQRPAVQGPSSALQRGFAALSADEDVGDAEAGDGGDVGDAGAPGSADGVAAEPRRAGAKAQGCKAAQPRVEAALAWPSWQVATGRRRSRREGQEQVPRQPERWEAAQHVAAAAAKAWHSRQADERRARAAVAVQRRWRGALCRAALAVRNGGDGNIDEVDDDDEEDLFVRDVAACEGGIGDVDGEQVMQDGGDVELEGGVCLAEAFFFGDVVEDGAAEAAYEDDEEDLFVRDVAVCAEGIGDVDGELVMQAATEDRRELAEAFFKQEFFIGDVEVDVADKAGGASGAAAAAEAASADPRGRPRSPGGLGTFPILTRIAWADIDEDGVDGSDGDVAEYEQEVGKDGSDDVEESEVVEEPPLRARECLEAEMAAGCGLRRLAVLRYQVRETELIDLREQVASLVADRRQALKARLTKARRR